MASIITATTTSGLTQSADNSGVLQLASGTGNLVTVPSVTGTAMVSGNMPTFSAYLSSGQTLSANTWTKITLQTEEWDTANCFNNSSTYHFTPNVAGYYQVNGSIRQDSNTNPLGCAIYKNNAVYRYGAQTAVTSGTASLTIALVTSLVYMNGTTDYIALWGYSQAGGALDTTSTSTYMNASLVRSA
tara:strand:- start:138 stop:698 length:561 start_codon:yes stop_codon:yes gene_type:complete